MCKRYSLNDAYDVAWQFAAKAHAGQKLPGSNLPYLTHIGWVVGEILISLQHETVSDPKLAIQCAILHDVIEDTSIGYQDLKEKFGSVVSNGVSALTKNMALPKNQRVMDSLERVLSQPNEVGMVKLADRISNLRTPPSFWAPLKINEYIEESNNIIEKLENTSTYLSERIKVKLKEYRDKFSK